ncbi:MAG: hypothetical protein JXB85_12695 [Anaerolineales bacterium]|nr:hypothetical protein [Anaerolineales bacterium]
MFLGQYRCPLEKDDVILLPDPYTEMLASGAFITQGFDHNLMVLNTGAFEELYSRIISMNIADPVARLLLRLFLGNATRVEVDEKGRFYLPKNLATLVQLDKEVVLIGQGEYFEIWPPEQWDVQLINLQDVEKNAQRFTSLDLAAR